MTATFRIIHFSPSPFSGQRVALGAAVREHGRWQFARAHHIPGPGCLGGHRSYSLVRMILDDLRRAESLEDLPVSLGPQVWFDVDQEVPAGVEHPLAWVQTHVLPRDLDDPADAKETRPPSPRRDALGYRFFERHKVASFVKHRFGPKRVHAPAKSAPKISHWVPGATELLLMEPLFAQRDAIENDLKEISTTFLAWHRLLQIHRPTSRTPAFVAYVFGGDDAYEMARSTLKESADLVVNVDHLVQRENFLAEIRRVGSSGGSQGTLLQ